MFERFTDRARKVVVLAQEEAGRLGHTYIGTEHILLGLLAEGEGVGACALAALGVSLDGMRERIEEMIGRGSGAPQGHIPFTPRAKKVLELSLKESRDLGHSYIGTEHVLLGLVREGEGVAAQALQRAGAGLARVREEVLAQLVGAGREYRAPEPRCPKCGIPLSARAHLWTEVHAEGAPVRMAAVCCGGCGAALGIVPLPPE